MPPADHRITLLSRTGCHLCDVARAVIESIAGEAGTPWEEVDVDGDAALRGEYGDRVPVVLIDGAEHGCFTVEAARLHAALAG